MIFFLGLCHGRDKKTNDSIISPKCSCINPHQGRVSTGEPQDNGSFCSRRSFCGFRFRVANNPEGGGRWVSIRLMAATGGVAMLM